MPTTLFFGPYRFYFWAQDCAEWRHTHVDRDNQSAKFWLDPEVRLAHNFGFSRSELRKIERIVDEHLETLRHEWDRFCTDAGAA